MILAVKLLISHRGKGTSEGVDLEAEDRVCGEGRQMLVIQPQASFTVVMEMRKQLCSNLSTSWLFFPSSCLCYNLALNHTVFAELRWLALCKYLCFSFLSSKHNHDNIRSTSITTVQQALSSIYTNLRSGGGTCRSVVLGRDG